MKRRALAVTSVVLAAACDKGSAPPAQHDAEPTPTIPALAPGETPPKTRPNYNAPTEIAYDAVRREYLTCKKLTVEEIARQLDGGAMDETLRTRFENLCACQADTLRFNFREAGGKEPVPPMTKDQAAECSAFAKGTTKPRPPFAQTVPPDAREIEKWTARCLDGDAGSPDLVTAFCACAVDFALAPGAVDTEESRLKCSIAAKHWTDTHQHLTARQFKELVVAGRK